MGWSICKEGSLWRVLSTRSVGGKAGIMAEMSLRLGEALGTSEDFWFRMQHHYDFWVASQGARKRIGRLREAA